MGPSGLTGRASFTTAVFHPTACLGSDGSLTGGRISDLRLMTQWIWYNLDQPGTIQGTFMNFISIQFNKVPYSLQIQLANRSPAHSGNARRLCHDCGGRRWLHSPPTGDGRQSSSGAAALSGLAEPFSGIT